MINNTNQVKLSDLFKVFFKLGTIGFGGPAAHVALMREEVVVKRSWLSESEFFDLVGATNLIPGPNSTELAIHIGHKFGGLKGLLVAGISFIFPAFFIVLLAAMFYGEYGSLPKIGSLLVGIRPVIVSIILVALWNFRKSSIRKISEYAVAVVALIASLAGYSEILIVLGGGGLHLLFTSTQRRLHSVELISIFYIFIKIGSVLFGSGYVLLAFLKSEFVDQRMWLTTQELLDAISIGQFTPGPVFTTATFVGYILSGTKGAILATIGIFLPSFFFVAITAPILPKIRESRGFSLFLDGVTSASFAIMAHVTYQLAQESLFNFPTVILFLLSFLVFIFFRLNSAFVIFIAGVIGYWFL